MSVYVVALDSQDKGLSCGHRCLFTLFVLLSARNRKSQEATREEQGRGARRRTEGGREGEESMND